MTAHTFKAALLRQKQADLLTSRPAWPTEKVLEHPKLQNDTLFQKKQTNNNNKVLTLLENLWVYLQFETKLVTMVLKLSEWTGFKTSRSEWLMQWLLGACVALFQHGPQTCYGRQQHLHLRQLYSAVFCLPRVKPQVCPLSLEWVGWPPVLRHSSADTDE